MNKLLLALLFVSFSVSATNYERCCSDTYITEVTEQYYTTEVTNVTEQYITDHQAYATELNSRMDNLNDRVNAVGAMGGAFGMLPANSHVSGGHGHLGLSIAGVNYNNANALAAGVNWSVENFNLKGAVSINDDNSDAMIGVGGNWTF